MRRFLLCGRSGQVGWELERLLAPLGTVVAVGRATLDLADVDQLRRTVREVRPDCIVNAAAFTAVDKAETSPDAAFAVNATAPGILAEEAARLGANLVHYSTDYVFDGTKATPYTEDDAPNPINAYGRSKLAGELAVKAGTDRHVILRTSWVYGLRGQNFLRTIRRLAAERDELRIVADQFGAPTWSRQIAAATALLLARKDVPSGLFHLAADGETTWHGFAAAIAAAFGLGPRIVPITTEQYPLPARRPASSRLDCSLLARECDIALPDWKEQLKLCCAEAIA